MGTSIDLPNDVIEQILSKCPIKSVIRFKSVSKSWQSIISDTRFSRIDSIRRSERSENPNKFMLLAPQTVLGTHTYLIRLEEDGIFTTESVLPYPSLTFDIPLCSCDGLILLGENGNDRHFLLWNPSIGKHIMITGPHNGPRPWLSHFYYDSMTDDHKIVFVYENSYTVYYCKKGSWSETKPLPCDLSLIYRRGASADGCFYGLVVSGEIVCFDTRDGNVHLVRLPDDVKDAVALTEVSGRLYLYGYLKDGKGLQKWAMEKNGSFEKWAMEKNIGLKKWCGPWGKLINMEKEEVADLWLKDNDYLAVRPAKKVTDNPRKNGFQEFDLYCMSRIFPYSENVYMPCSNYGDLGKQIDGFSLAKIKEKVVSYLYPY